DIGAFELGGIPTTAPVVQFESPVNGQVNSQGPVTLIVDVTSSSGEIAKVEFYKEGKIAEISQPPYQYTTPDLSAGNYNYRARAIDIYGNISSFANVSFKVQSLDGNMIVNGEFDFGLTAWQLADYTGPDYTPGTNSASVIQSGGLSGENAAQIKITSINNQNWTIQLSQKPTSFNLKKGNTYEISFQAKAASDRTITSAIRGNTTNTDFFNQTVSLTKDATSYGPYTYTCKDDTVSNESGFTFSFYMAKGVLADVFLDKVVVKDVTVPTVNIETPNSEQQIALFPNPASDVLNLLLPDLGGNLRIQIYSLTGQLMSENLIDAQNAQAELNVRTLPNGIYLLTIKGNNGSQTKKFIVSR
ncbi:MAG: T9SS type A sorting domain-containing protein, partial [Bacteroidota bacterium]|nr:T9SS type A sorting domain-containing protein [Bacteroidota bacterium]